LATNLYQKLAKLPILQAVAVVILESGPMWDI